MSEALKYLFEMQDDSKRMVCEIKRLEDLILEGNDAERGLAPGASGMMGAPCMTAELATEADAIRERRKA